MNKRDTLVSFGNEGLLPSAIRWRPAILPAAIAHPGNEGLLPSAIRWRPAILPAAIAHPGTSILPSSKRCLRMILPAAIAALTSMLLISCTPTGGERSVASAPSKFARFPHSAASSDCFYQQRVDNFEVLNDSNLLVMEGRRRVYHVEVSPPSMDLRHAYGIHFSSTTGRVCGNPGERLQVQNGSFSSFPLSVTGVYRLDEATQSAVRAHFGQTTPLPPQEKENAEAVEELVTDLEEAADDSGQESPPDASGENQEN